MTVNKISSLSIVRVVAMLSIIAGHLCGWAGINTFQLGGIGVEMFLFLSGYLYGNKKLVDSKSWLVKRFLRLMPTIWWAAAFIAIFYFIQKGFTYTFPRLLLFTFNLQGIGWIFRDLEVLTFPELAQTWFVTVIFICYLLTAILKKWGGGKALASRRKEMLAIVAVAVILLGLLHIEVSYILQYFTGYCVARAGVTSINKRQMRFLTAAMFVACMTRLATRHYLDGTRLYDSVIALLSWNVLGIWLVAVLVCICQKHVCWVEKMVASKAWRHLDALSYPLYVAHYPFLQGLLRVNNYIENTMVQFLAFVAFTVLLAEALLVLTTRGQANR